MYMGDAPADAAGITNGATGLTGFTDGRVLRVNGSLIGEYGITGSGSVVMSTGATLVTPALGVATATSLAIGGATLGGNALAVTGTALFSSNAALVLTNQSSGAAAAVGTLTNAPKVGNPDFWIPVSVNGTAGWVPWWHA